MNALVSVIIPYFNNESTIEETIDSVLSQTYQFIEIIIINDGSFKNLLDVIDDKYKNINITFLEQNNSGVSHARNYGAKNSKGEYLLFLDADDVIKPSYIEKCVKKFNNPEVKIAYTKARLFGRENTSWDLPNYTDFKSFLRDNIIYVSAIIKRKDFINADGFDTDLIHYEDWDLWISILKNGGNVVKIDEELFLYRKTESLESATDKADKSENIRAVNRLKIFLKHHDTYAKYYTNFEDLFFKYLSYEEKRKKISSSKKLKNKIKKLFKNNS